ncbi:two component transcriptional regulator, LuxR family [Methylorubrum populi BJ001]|jgi:DNA-binding NarL/FixJ family response regulator|uniref:Two component transcriptional regulator, LuxR family n=1 Tax=Methylorubrum populi (strain ATCC BAA-705 / NCIMB 13946 / BJ001) TaxID=441620 RepID=B1Z9J5_METPB|nr:response regulator transcription factor [Methylorubrum populi]ACB81959.1 two component transcriptional regulator, LuxR family [Methylorubrum populi BJ001]
MTGKRIRVLVVDDHAVVREGYRRLLEKQPDIEVVAEAEDASSAYLRFRATAPDVVIMDISMPGRGGIDAIRQIRQADPTVRILVFSMHATVSYAVQAIRAGARGYITKSSASDLMVEAVRNVFQNKLTLCAEISKILATSRLEEQVVALDELSPREFEVLRMIIDAKSTEEIAAAFHLTPKTVANYHYAIKSKLGVSSDIDLVYFCMRHGVFTSIAGTET